MYFSFATVSTSLPFDNGGSVAFTPAMNDAGEISVHAGDCTAGLNGSSLWRFTPDKIGANGTWTSQNITAVESGGKGTLGTANYLSSGMSFSSSGKSNVSNTQLYYFGGMCPVAESETSTWTMLANYSNSLIHLEPLSSTANAPPSPPKYSLVVSQSKNSPIAEAGFSMTALQPTFSSSSAGIETVHVSYLLLGGHTQTAFTNMSQAALFSLPEESWSYLRINLPSENERPGLAARTDAVEIDSRSGHTAVLTEDGKKLIVFGGWVGDINTPADPQLIILEIGQGYGGVSDWAWSIASPVGSGIEPRGLYGHGAVMLPGGVMMILGGYLIPAVNGLNAQTTDQTRNSRAYFFNTTTGTWVSSYTSPGPSKTPGEKPSNKQGTGPLSTPSKKAALGSGLALGLSAIVGAMAVGYWYSRRSRKRRDIREKELREFALGAARFHSSGLGLAGIDGRGGEKLAVDWMGETVQHKHEQMYPRAAGGLGGGFGEGPSWRENGGTEAERTGLLVEIPSPTRGLRRSLHARSRTGERVLPYQMVSGYDDGRRSLGAPGAIHPIDERDEYEQQGLESSELAIGKSTDSQSIRASAGPAQDPFGDPPKRAIVATGSNEKSEASRERELEIQEWVTDWAIADAVLAAGGRLSPGRSSPDKDRTHSNLSERSIKSASSGPSHSTISRSLSQRSTSAYAAANLLSPSDVSLDFDQPGRHSPSNRRSRSLNLFQRPDSGGNNSFQTAATSFSQLRTEGEELLPRQSSNNAIGPPESPTKGKSRSPGWMGSIRRALGGERNASPVSNRSASSSPIKDITEHDDAQQNLLPRRAASTSAMLWRKKQGAADWDVERPTEAGGRPAEGEDEEWDVEAAVENRVVQVMFTVPKEKLRVVNADRDAISDTDIEPDETGDIEMAKGKEIVRDPADTTE
ncbi:hypothetical protein FGG08_002057 [Glutinoglossum americanum]|uniref:Galactose oxidase n=1 Tax=Glutinoglossum americanum TaxID=1670608 RepID=A0A9P8I0U3_9PEZI|nr:hypothetical protein FGG08_002057 [Glutinoglossum americanum]